MMSLFLLCESELNLLNIYIPIGMFLLRVVALVSLLRAATAACTFRVPNPDNSCAIYDLSPFSSPQGTSVAASPYTNYIINVCDDASLPGSPRVLGSQALLDISCTHRIHPFA